MSNVLPQVVGGSLCARTLSFYDARFAKMMLQNRVPTYDVGELQIDAKGGHLQSFDFVCPHGFNLGADEVQIAQLVVFHNLRSLRSLKVNYALWRTPLSLSDPIAGLKELVNMAQKEQVRLPSLERLSLTMSRIAYSEFRQLCDGSAYLRRLVAPRLTEIELCPGSSNWHNEQGFVPFLSGLIGEQLWKLRRIKIRYRAFEPQANQMEFLEACIDRMLKEYLRTNEKIEITLETASKLRQFTTEGPCKAEC